MYPMASVRRILLVVFAAMLLAGAGGGGAAFLCIGSDGRVRIKTIEERHEACDDVEVPLASAAAGSSQVGDQRFSRDADCCVDVLIFPGSQTDLGIPIRGASVSTRTAVASVCHAVESFHLTTVPHQWNPHSFTNDSIASLRTVILLV